MSREAAERKNRERLGVEPRIPATDVRGGLPDFSSERPASGDGGPGRATLWVIAALVVAVGALFWWLGGTRPAPASAGASTKLTEEPLPDLVATDGGRRLQHR